MGLTVIKTWCPRDGEQNLTSDEFHLRTYQPVGRGTPYYEFVCPECMVLIRREADVYVVKALRLGQVHETVLVLPDEFSDPKREWTLPLTLDDLLDFGLALSHTDFVAQES